MIIYFTIIQWFSGVPAEGIFFSVRNGEIYRKYIWITTSINNGG